MTRWLAILILLALAGRGVGQVKAPPNVPPDDRYKTDILLIVAHPDDEGEISGYLARAIFDQHKRVAIIYGTRGNSGGNVVGREQASSLAAVREIEARRAVEKFGITNVWFLGGPDTPGQDVLRSLETWDHGACLGQVVRLVRLTRPEVILTWLPDYIVGENHGDHQASSVLATEAFDMAGDPTAFPEQVAPPRNRTAVGNLTEGLRPWQPQKIYYFSDTAHPDSLKSWGPEYSITDESPSQHKPYNQMIAEEASEHLTQYGVGLAARDALAKHDFHALEHPIQFVFGKSVVKCTQTGDIFEGVSEALVPFAKTTGYKPNSGTGVSLELGGPWAFYRLFWAAHGIDHLGGLVSPEAASGADGLLYVPLVITNNTAQECAVTLRAVLPSGWAEKSGSAIYDVAPHDSYPITAILSVPQAAPQSPALPRPATWQADCATQPAREVTLRVFPHQGGGLPQ
ncbi:MAG TPA: PIG-L family deacetylase [Blastocatellia bacterium]